MAPLTELQHRVYDFVRQRLQAGESAPTMREIADHFHWKAKRAAECHIKALIKKQWLTHTAGQTRSLRLVETLPCTVTVPIFGSIPAGLPQDRAEEGDGCITVDVQTLGFQPTRNTFALRVTGDSMIGRHILPGDIVVLEHGPDPRHGQIVAALIDGRSTLKTFILKRGKPYLKAENPEYPDLIPAEELMIQGVFRALIRRAAD